MQKKAMSEKVIILDRDGVINKKIDGYVRTPDEWVPIDGSLDAMIELHRSNYRLVVATNQAGIGHGIMTVDDLIMVHAKMQSMLGVQRAHVDGLFFCPHAPQAKCKCRKPEPGLLNSIARRYRISLTNTYFIGDSMVDVKAGLAAGAKPMMVRTGLGETESEKVGDDIPVYDNLAEATRAILEADGQLCQLP